MASKIEKKELLEPDKLQLFVLTLRTFAEKHRARIFAGAAIFLLAILLAGGIYLYQLQYEANAGKTYNRVFESAMKAGSPAGDNEAIKGYKDLIHEYPRSHAAVTAHYRLGNLYFNRNEFDAAIIAYQEFLKKSPAQSDLVPLAYSGLGACHEAKKDFAKALESFESAIKSNAASSFEALNFSNIARVHEALNNPAKAVEFYRKALGKTTDPLMTLYLKRKLSILG
ncbi:MAG: tetratricopeptide repeat protein [Syntrophales bacterium]|jgi:tetratricopeptide (TPR) repeat protein|nr:tetratricopeptide repeat protein [Syntrophales bacterium]